MKTCAKCVKSKDESEFNKQRTSRDGLNYWCRECCNRATRDHFRTLDGALIRLLDNAKTRSKKRGDIGREEASRFEIDKAYVRQLYADQGGRCYHSGLPMSIEKCTWKVSMERLDPARGYIPGNAVLCCLGLNTQAGWTAAKSLQVVQNHFGNGGEQLPIEISFDEVAKEKKKPVKHAEKICDGELHYLCKGCSEFHHHTKFNKAIRDGCTICRRRRHDDRINTPRGFIMQLLGMATFTTKKRNKVAGRQEMTNDIDFDYVVDLIKKQGGRCAISGMPLAFGPGKDWACSIERIDVNVGYVRGNIIAIATEFQAIDHSVDCKTDDDEEEVSYGWSRAKFLTFVESTRRKLGLYCN